MALVPISGGGNNDAYLQMALMQQMGQMGSGIAQNLQGHRQKQALAQLLAGKPAEQGPGLSAITKQLAPGLDPSLAGPSLAMTGGQMAKPATPGLLETGQLTPQMAQAFMLQGGDPTQLASFMPKQLDPLERAKLGVEMEKLGLERQKLEQGPGPMSSAGKIAADLGVDLRTPEGQAAVAALAKGMQQAGASVTLKNEAQVPVGYRAVRDEQGNLISYEPVPGGPALEVSGPAAAAQALVPGAISEVQRLEGALFPQGQYDRTQALTMNAPVIGAIPNTAGEGLRAAMQSGTMAILRHESGGAITDQELQNKLDTYMPGPLDTPDVARQKWERYKRDLENTLRTATQGRGPPPTVPPSQPGPAQPGMVDQLIQQGLGAVQQMMPQGAINLGTGQRIPAVGAVDDGFRFRGGDPADPNNWEPAR